MNNTHLELKELSHHYNTSDGLRPSIESLDLKIQFGELVGLLGPSGCGKTTLLRLIAGFEKPSTGSVSISDQIVATPTRQIPPEKRGIGMVFQDYALFPHLNSWQNVCFGLRNNQDKSRALWLLDLLGLADFRFRYPHELSGGQRQRLALARALAPGSSLVVLDEPFSNLDVEVRNKLRAELSGVLRSCSATGLLVTHDPQEALAICDRVAVMKNGKIQQCSTPVNLVNQPATSFVARFVLQRNVFPIKAEDSLITTPLGPLENPFGSTNNTFNELMIDDNSLTIIKDIHGEAIVTAREFLGKNWLIRVSFKDLFLKILHPFDESINTGDRCTIQFKSSNKGILFPGSKLIDLRLKRV